MKSSTKDEIKGTFHELKGKGKEKVGHATNNRKLEVKGIAEKLGGKIQRMAGQLKDAFAQ